jgi:A/G-specific adenine glycosylase
MTALVEQERNTALLSWYRAHGRSLPWRGETDPYLVLVSEVMLQQTQASRVVPFYQRFVARFPTAEVLAGADLRDVLDAWSGLGYNARAVRLREAARIITERGWPTTPGALIDLPGVGPYTAAAIASFAFGVDVPAVDTNLRRVLSRWHGESLSGATLAAVAAANLAAPAAEWNQAMMDLGATVCLPKDPHCCRCPVADWCSGADAYTPPTPQGRFEGSARQLRGAIVRTLVAHPGRAGAIARHVGFPRGEVEEALGDLTLEGIVTDDGTGTYRISG